MSGRQSPDTKPSYHAAEEAEEAEGVDRFDEEDLGEETDSLVCWGYKN